jgi:LacI family transcriptional regulator
LTNKDLHDTLLVRKSVSGTKSFFQKEDVVPQQPTLAEIAAEAGVSLPTVSRVLNQRPDVSPETRQRVLDVLAARGYRKKTLDTLPKVPALTLVSLVITGWLDSEFYLEIVRGIEEILLPRGARLMLSTMHRNQRFVQDWLDQLTQSPPQGAIFLNSDYPQIFARLRKLRVPFVAIDDTVPADLQVPSVGANNWTSGLTATEYLLSLGHRRVAIITGPSSHLVSKGRIAGYRTALETAGLAFDPSYVRESDFGMESGFLQTQVLLDLPNPPTALIAACDAQAIGVYQAIYRRGWRVPEDISVIGFDNIPTSQWMSPPLTTVGQPLRDLGHAAAERLFQLMAGKALESLRVELVSPLLVRSSCTSPALQK